jgi:glycosyltransferase involved in cell wall biosynthesis
MDVALHWSGDWPEHVAPLLAALESLPEAAEAREGSVAFCPDAAALRPPSDAAAKLVAMVPHSEGLFDPGRRSDLVAALGPWAERGALFTIPTSTAAAALRALLELSADRVSVVPLPLPPARIQSIPVPAAPPVAPPTGDVLALSPIAYGTLLPAIGLLRLADLEPRLVLAAPEAGAFVRPGGLATGFGLLPGREVVATEDWRAAAVSAAVVVMADGASGRGWTIREALATGTPVVAPNTPLVRDHLAACGASAYLYAGPHDVRTLADALVGALRGDRGAALGSAAREAVLAESWETAARQLYGALSQSLDRPDAVAPGPMPARVEVVRDRLALCVVNPKASGGGGERFMRQMVHAMAAHRSGPRVKLICKSEPHIAFDPGTAILERAGVEVRVVPESEFDRTLATELDGSDVVYCSWPHQVEPPATDAPLVCTFHDLNWKHFDVIGPADKQLLELQTPRWIERSAAMVHSSEFIRGELHRYYDAPASLTRVIHTAVDPPAQPPTAAECAGVRRKFALPDRFVLSPNGRHLHKNYPVLDAALRVLRRSGRPVSVVASGSGTEFYCGPDLIGLGYVTARELQALYDECDGVVQTTLYEAGSFPMFEAMVAGKAVAISRIPSIDEQLERVGAVAELFDPHDPEDVAEAIWRLWVGSAATEADTIAENMRAVAARTWDDVAGDYLQLFSEIPR